MLLFIGLNMDLMVLVILFQDKDIKLRMFNAIDSYSFPDVGGLRIELTPTVPEWVHEMPILSHPNDTRTLVRVVNMLGQEVDPDTRFKGEILLYLFSDGTTEKEWLNN